MKPSRSSPVVVVLWNLFREKAMRKLMTTICAAAALFTAPLTFAEGLGADIWTGLAKNEGLFTPHPNHCDTSTFVFVAIGAGSSYGYCIEKDQRSAATWEEARQTCATIGARLPEPGEYKYACKNPPTGLTNMTNDFEWASNYPLNIYSDSSFGGVGAAVAGGGGCTYLTFGAIGANPGSEGSAPFRCVK